MLPATVITADVIGSRAQPAIMALLPERLERLRHLQLSYAFTLSRGDEIQGVASGYLAAPELIRLLRHACRPLELRVGLGLGLVPARNAASSWDLTGEAFFRAREALETVKRNGRHSANTCLASWDADLDAIANALFELMDATWSHWTPAQWEATSAYETAGTYEAAAKSLGIAFQNVEKRCRAARWPAIRAGEAGLRRLGQRYLAVSPERA